MTAKIKKNQQKMESGNKATKIDQKAIKTPLHKQEKKEENPKILYTINNLRVIRNYL